MIQIFDLKGSLFKRSVIDLDNLPLSKVDASSDGSNVNLKQKGMSDAL